MSVSTSSGVRRLAGAACRMLSRRDEARHWFDLPRLVSCDRELPRPTSRGWPIRSSRSEPTSTATYDRAGTAAAPVAIFERLGMAGGRAEGPLPRRRSRSGAATLRRPEPFRRDHRLTPAPSKARALLAGTPTSTSLRSYGFLGETEEAMAVRAGRRMPLLLRLGASYGPARQTPVRRRDILLRKTGKLGRFHRGFSGISAGLRRRPMHADVAAIHLILGDLLLDAGRRLKRNGRSGPRYRSSTSTSWSRKGSRRFHSCVNRSVVVRSTVRRCGISTAICATPNPSTSLSSSRACLRGSAGRNHNTSSASWVTRSGRANSSLRFCSAGRAFL